MDLLSPYIWYVLCLFNANSMCSVLRHNHDSSFWDVSCFDGADFNCGTTKGGGSALVNDMKPNVNGCHIEAGRAVKGINGLFQLEVILAAPFLE